MSALASYFVQAMSNIEPGEDAINAKTAHADVSAVLTKSQPLINLGINPVLIGSYAREVSIRRVKDVDVFGRLTTADENLRPGHAIDLFEEALEDEYDGRIERQHRSIKVDFPNFNLAVDVVPARPCGDHWEIPRKTDQDNRASWKETNPLRLNELTSETNKAFTLNDKGIYVPTVKLVRQVRRFWVGGQPGGFFFEILTYWAFNEGDFDADSRAGYLVAALECIEQELPKARDDGLDDPTMDGHVISTKATEADFDVAIARIGEAADLARRALEEPDDCRSAVLWRQLLGKTSDGTDVFPLPEYCNADGSTRATPNTKVGAVVSPAGSGRYA
jgi:hypothetical protein